MKKDQLPFKIGQHYENWEFDLEVCINDKIKEFDSYIYLKSFKFLNIIPLQTELIFFFDILELVIMTIKTKDDREMENLIDLMTKTFGDYIEHEQEYLSACIYNLEDSNVLLLIYKRFEAKTYIAYGSSKLIIQLFSK